MRSQAKLRCPNPSCVNREAGSSKRFLRNGYFLTKWNRKWIPRFKCRACRKGFSSSTGLPKAGQHRPDLNEPVFELYASGMTQRRMALVLGVNRKTVVRKFLFAARLAREEHEIHMAKGALAATSLQFDEQETFEHTKFKPLTVALAVDAAGLIVDIKVARMGYKGPLAAMALRKYGPRKDESHIAIESVLQSLRRVARTKLTLVTDANPRYRNRIRQAIPYAQHHAAKITHKKTDRRNKNDELFALNYTFAKIRNDLSRMSRKTWVTTKKPERLQAHLDLYIAYANKYSFSLAA